MRQQIFIEVANYIKSFSCLMYCLLFYEAEAEHCFRDIMYAMMKELLNRSTFAKVITERLSVLFWLTV